MNRRASRILTVCAAVWLLVIWGHSCLPAAQSGAESGALLVVVQDLLPWMTDHVLRVQRVQGGRIASSGRGLDQQRRCCWR